jgi:hypothetical protein
MARVTEPTADQEAGWKAWVAERPPEIRAVAERFDPWSLYRLKSTGQRCTLYSFSEGQPVTMTVDFTGEHNLMVFDRRVFGIDPNDLEPCDLPTPDEPVGALLTEQEDIDAFVDAVRPLVVRKRT